MDLFLVALIVAVFEVLLAWLWFEWRVAIRGWKQAARQRDLLFAALQEATGFDAWHVEELTGISPEQPKLRAVK